MLDVTLTLAKSSQPASTGSEWWSSTSHNMNCFALPLLCINHMYMVISSSSSSEVLVVFLTNIAWGARLGVHEVPAVSCIVKCHTLGVSDSDTSLD